MKLNRYHQSIAEKIRYFSMTYKKDTKILNISPQAIPDQEQRDQALDSTKSFIVQAPAGSGKTSLLVQRYLTLLAQAQNPQEIIAITFTRKAAGEMRERIINALDLAEQIGSKESASKSPDLLANIAQKVLAQDQKKHWNLLHNSHLFRIQTIDSLCSYITKQTPILARSCGSASIVQNQQADNYYRKAVRIIMQNSAEFGLDRALEILLLHLDNDVIKTEELLLNMLKRRDQWLPHVLQNHERETIEQALINVREEILEKLATTFPKEHCAEVVELLIFATGNLKNMEFSIDFSQHIDFKQNFSAIKSAPGIALWQMLTRALITNDGEWRKRLEINQGFPAKNSTKDKEEQKLFAEMKARMRELTETLSNHPQSEEILQNLRDFAAAPPTNYTDDQWEVVSALLEILPILTAQLTVLFNENDVADYTEIALAADRALGNTHNPTDITLNLDYQIKHILIDEFQDTSITQLRLIEKLLCGWQPEDGKTLFLVGDPMQSIYRFRQAEVGIFLRAQHTGIGTVKLIPLTLTTNFRATQSIINWLNENFCKILPRTPGITYGAVNFVPATANPKQEEIAEIDVEQQGVKIRIFTDNSAESDDNSASNHDNIEAKQICTIIQALQQNDPGKSIAILARTRTHLAHIIEKLQSENIAYQAPEIKKLDSSPIIQDLFALTRALLHPADKIAWLAILRAPWCGLQLTDLHCISNGIKQTIWENINDAELLRQISSNGQQRLHTFTQIIGSNLIKRSTLNLKNYVYKTWLALHGPACVLNENELENAEIFFTLLEDFALQNLGFVNITSLKESLQNLYAATSNNSALQLMTVHKAKGLEFDHVIIPGIHKSTRKDINQLLIWMERSRPHGGNDLLIAPIKARNDDEKNTIYDFLRRCEQKKSNYELGRLLYVAMTRAKKSLHLFGQFNPDKNEKVQNPAKDSLLQQIWPCFNEHWLEAVNAENKSPAKKNFALKIRRLKNMAAITTFPDQNSSYHKIGAQDFYLQDQTKSYLGQVIHKALAMLCQESTEISPQQIEKYIDEQKKYWQRLLREFGCRDNLLEYLQTIAQAVTNTVTDPRGQWIIDHNQREAQTEFAITTAVNGQEKILIIDRTFIDQHGIRWIIDYKTATPHDNEGTEQFLEREQQTYLSQLNQYARALKNSDLQCKIMLGLYFPLNALWAEHTPLD